MFPLFSTLAITQTVKAGRTTFKAHSAVWVQGTHSSMPKTVPAGHVMIGKTNQACGAGVVVSEEQLAQFAKIEL